MGRLLLLHLLLIPSLLSEDRSLFLAFSLLPPPISASCGKKEGKNFFYPRASHRCSKNRKVVVVVVLLLLVIFLRSRLKRSQVERQWPHGQIASTMYIKSQVEPAHLLTPAEQDSPKIITKSCLVPRLLQKKLRRRKFSQRGTEGDQRERERGKGVPSCA